MAKAFEPSMRAARRLGPKTGIPTVCVCVCEREPKKKEKKNTIVKVSVDTLDKRSFWARDDEIDTMRLCKVDEGRKVGGRDRVEVGGFGRGRGAGISRADMNMVDPR